MSMMPSIVEAKVTAAHAEARVEKKMNWREKPVPKYKELVYKMWASLHRDVKEEGSTLLHSDEKKAKGAYRYRVLKPSPSTSTFNFK